MPKNLNHVRTPVAAALVAAAMLGGAGIGLAAAGLAGDEDEERQVSATAAADPAAGAVGTVPAAPGLAAPAPPAPAPAEAGSPAPGGVGPDRAGRIAVAHVGGGVVDDVYGEDDYGAAWEVDVYSPRGEFEVYVSASGQVVRVLGPYDD